MGRGESRLFGFPLVLLVRRNLCGLGSIITLFAVKNDGPPLSAEKVNFRNQTIFKLNLSMLFVQEL